MKKIRISARILATVLALIIALPFAAFAEDATIGLISAPVAGPAEQQDYAKFMEIYDLYRKYYYIDKAPEEMLLDAIEGLMEQNPELYRQIVDALLSSGDPYSHYMDLETVHEEETYKIYGGVGVTVAVVVEGLSITEVTPQSPADEAGIKVGDIATAIDGRALKNLTLDVISEFARGEVGTAVAYSVLRPSTGEVLSFEMIRSELMLVTVVYELHDTYAVCRINDFSGFLTVLEFISFLGVLEDTGIKNIIFDVRDNPGGELLVTLDMLNFLIPGDDRPLTTIIPRDETQSVTYYTTGRGKELGKIAILVNGHTASAAELFAVALQEYQLAKVIGTATFGKAIGQTQFILDDGTNAVITTLQATSPAGRKYHEKGVAPDIFVTNTSSDRILPACEVLNFDNFASAYIGADSVATLALEQRLVILGLLNTADTVFDADTAAALSVFQRRVGIEETGTFTSETLIGLTDMINLLKTIKITNDDQMATAVAMMEEGS